MANNTVTVHLEIIGLVQGVGYRESMRAVAAAVGVTGWVRNRANGSVEAMVQGEETDVERVIAWCHSGPPNAHVRLVEVHRIETGETLSGFTRRPSA